MAVIKSPEIRILATLSGQDENQAIMTGNILDNQAIQHANFIGTGFD
jgi:hypothetical protein